jgi:hypothetical protein
MEFSLGQQILEKSLLGNEADCTVRGDSFNQ